jgi:superfamily II DNA/RNA helicase
MAAFRAGSIRTLVATDIAARGIDVDGISHVVNYDLPNIPETYVHRIGRTARAGAAGIAISLVAGDEMAFLRDIEKLIRRPVPMEGGPAYDPLKAEPKRPNESRGARSGRNDGAPGRGRKPHRANRPPYEAPRPRYGDRDAPRQVNRDAPRQGDRAPAHAEPRGNGGEGIAAVGFMMNSGRRP